VLNVLFVTGLALALAVLIVWGVRTLPAERWQMLAAIPLAKAPDGTWRGLNLTFYGLFSALGTTVEIKDRRWSLGLQDEGGGHCERVKRKCADHCCTVIMAVEGDDAPLMVATTG